MIYHVFYCLLNCYNCSFNVIYLCIKLIVSKIDKTRPCKINIAHPKIDEITSDYDPCQKAQNRNNMPSINHFTITNNASASCKYDSLFEEIARDAVSSGQISASYIQRKYEVGFNRAGRIMIQLERARVIGPQIGAAQRKINFDNIKALEKHLSILIAGDTNAELEELHRQERERVRIEREKEEIAARIKEKYRRRQLEKLVRQELIDSGELFGEQPKRPHIPREVVDAVYSRDGGRCVHCGSTDNLQLDHIIPFSKGGATTLENLQLLCQKCNLEKSNKIG